jgi:hypothetical protein
MALLLLPVLGAALAQNFTLSWASAPALANDTVLFLGGPDLSPVTSIRFCSTASGCASSPNLQATATGAKAVLPSLDVFSATACGAAGCAPAALAVNAPRVKWTQADVARDTTSPGGGLRAFGEALAFAGGTCVATRNARGAAALAAAAARLAPTGGGAPVALALTFASCWALTAAVPADAPLGLYVLEVRNGLPGCAWTPAGALTLVAPPTPWPTTVFNVNNTAGGVWGALAAAKANNGGIVFFPRGTYTFNATATLDAIPPFTTLLGESAETVTFAWRDVAGKVNMDSALVSGSAGNFAVVNATLYVQGNFTNVISDNGFDGLRLSSIVVYALPYYGLLDNVSAPFHGRSMPVGSGNSQGSLVSISGDNWRVSDCSFFGGGSRGFYVHARDRDTPTWLGQSGNGVLERSRVRGAFNTYGLESVNGIVFENNDFEGDLTCYGSFMATYFGKSTENIYFGSNRVGGWHGADHELLTMDGGGGAYFGGVAATSADGRTLTLAKDPVFAGYYPTGYQPRLFNYTGGAVVVLAGVGAGQWRRVVKNDWAAGGTNRSWVIDAPFAVALDASSVLSIVPFRGNIVIVDNAFHDGGGIQLYAMAIATTVAENTASRTSGFMAWGLNPHSWGYQPNVAVQFLANTVLVGASYGGQRGGFASMSGDDANFTGFLNRGVVFRGNVGESDASILIGGTTAEVVVERNAVRNADVGVSVANTTAGVLLRGNVYSSVVAEETRFDYYAPGLHCCCNATDALTGVPFVVKPMSSFTVCASGSCEDAGEPDVYQATPRDNVSLGDS